MLANGGADLSRSLAALKYAGLENLDKPDCLFLNAKILADRIDLGKRDFNYLYEKSRFKLGSRADWEMSVKTAFAIQHLVGKISRDDLMTLVDAAAKQAVLAEFDESKGALVVVCHAGFNSVGHAFFANQNAVYMTVRSGVDDPNRIAVGADVRGALFAGLKTLLAKKKLLLAPDGVLGLQKIRHFGFRKVNLNG